MQKDISQMDITSLKAMAYDEFAQVQLHQQNLALLNQQIEKKMAEKLPEASNPEFVKEPEVIKE